MIVVGQQQLQGVTPRRKLERGLRLAPAKVFVLVIIWNGQSQIGEGCVDQEMMVSGVWACNASRGHAHVFESKADGHRAFELCSVGGSNEVEFRITR